MDDRWDCFFVIHLYLHWLGGIGWLVGVAWLDWRLISGSSSGNLVLSLPLELCYVHIVQLPITCPNL